MRTARRGITMMEVAIGTLLVGGVLAATLQLVGPTVRATQLAGDRLIAAALADDMINEIAAKAYADPTQDTGAIGPESGEISSNRTSFDDADDYDGWSAAPFTEYGTAISGIGSGWAVRVRVVHASISNPAADSVTETGLKRVRVVVSRNGVNLADRTLLRSEAFAEALEGP